MWQLFDQIRVLLAHILRVAAKHPNRAVGEQVYLRSLAVILILAGEAFVLKAIQHLPDRLCWLGKHGLQWNARSQLALFT